MTITFTTPTTETKRREPLKPLDMATSQAHARPPPGASGQAKGRRTSARLSLNHEESAGVAVKEKGKKKRKADGFDEDVEGFQFSRVTSKKAKSSLNAVPELRATATAENATPQRSPRKGRPRKKRLDTGGDGAADPKPKSPEVGSKRQTRANAKTTDAETPPGSATRSTRSRGQTETIPVEKKRKKGRPSKSKSEARNGFVSPESQETGTKITLPMADTPVIQRNKEMRAEKSKKGSRRSSLTMRGRRASSLIDSGASNALPHKEVDTAEFYKHIASDLPEPRRMRQLLTWCATRAMGDKPSGSRSEDESARLAARHIQDEILKDFSTNSDLSNWFSREDVNPPAVVVNKPNPKNVQNTDKIKELEEQIQRLQRERHALNALLRPPSIPSIKPRPKQRPSTEQPNPQQSEPSSKPEVIDTSLLDPSQQAILATLDTTAKKRRQSDQPTPSTSNPPIPISAISTRLSRITSNLTPILDTFAAGIHDIDLYRAMADTVSSRVLRICSERLEERDARDAMRRLAISDGSTNASGDEGDREKDSRARMTQHDSPPREDLGLVLGALSRVERR